MKKLFFAVVLLLTTLTANAQRGVFNEYDGLNYSPVENYREKNFQIRTGFGFSELVGTTASSYSAFCCKLAFSYDVNLVSGLYLIPEVDFIVKGSQPTSWSQRLNLTYLQVPVCLAWKFELPRDMKIGIKAGPYAAVGLFGSQVGYEIYDDIYESASVFDSYYGSNRFDAGLLTGVQFDFHYFTVGMEYSYGFIMLNRGYEDLNGFNSTFDVSFGVRF